MSEMPDISRRAPRTTVWRSAVVGGMLVVMIALTSGAAESSAAMTPSVTTQGGISYVTKTFTLQRGEWRTFRAPCPAGTHVLGGGHANNASFGGVVGAHSFPYDGGDRDTRPDDGWAALLGAFGRVRTVRIQANCAEHLPTYVAQGFSVAPRSRGEGSVPCPSSAPNVLSGGSRGSRMLQQIYSLFEGGFHSWKVVADNHDNEGRTLKAVAVCSSLPLTGISIRVDDDRAAPRARSSLSPTPCSADQYVVGGGGGVPNPPFATVAIAATRRIGTTGWEVSVDNFGSDPQQTWAGLLCVDALA